MTNEALEHDLAVVRLGADSVAEINRILEVNSEDELPIDIEIACKQVPREISTGTFAFIWLGTHNNKGGPTPWVQGLRALGRITNIEGGPNYNDQKTVGISVGVVFPDSLTKKDFIRQTGDEYINISDLPVVGINNYSSQVIQRIDPAEESQQIDVLVRAIAGLIPSFAPAIESSYPELADLLHLTPKPASKEPESGTEKLLIELPENDLVFTELLARVQRLLKDGFGGIILRGPPGTSKSYYARLIAAELADRDSKRIRFVQFHPSYQYEDFMEGFVPDLGGGTFTPKLKHFLQICEDAAKDSTGRPYVLVIDEFSRTDPARVLGEALTYIEKSKRGEEFDLASGRKVVVPPNLIVIATMNVWDRGVDDVDVAVERRFAHIAMESSRESLLAILTANKVEEELSGKIVQFFDNLQRDPNPLVRVGHAYFHDVRDESGMHRLWQHQLRFIIARAFPLAEDGYKRIESVWKHLFPEGPAASEEEPGELAGGTEGG
jgi:5-methylcytosine-specific restriction protein B